MKKKYVVIFILLSSIAKAQSPLPKQYSLQEVITMSLNQSWVLKNAAIKSEIVDAKKNQAINAFIPQVGIAASYTRLSTNIEPFTISIPGLGEKSLNPVIPNQFNNRVAVQQPIFNGTRNLNNLAAAKNKQEANSMDTKMSEIDIKIGVIQSYYNYWKTLLSAAVLRENENLANKRAIDVKNYFDNGVALANDVTRAELNKSAIALSLAEVENATAILNYNLLLQMGIQDNVNIQPAPQDLELSSKSTLQLVNNNESILANRYDFKSAQLRIAASKKYVNATKSAYMPSLSAGFNFYYNNPNMRVFPQENKFKDTWDAGLSLNWNLSSLYSAGALMRESKANLKMAENATEQLKDGIKSEVFAAKKGYELSLKKIQLSELALSQATENQIIVKNKVDAAVSLFTDLIDADNQKLQTQLNLVAAKCDAQVAYFKYLKSIGQLN